MLQHLSNCGFLTETRSLYSKKPWITSVLKITHLFVNKEMEKKWEKNKKTELGHWYQKLNVRVNSRVVRQFKVYYFRKWRICSDLRGISRLTTAGKVYVFGLFLVRIFLHLDWKRTRKAPNADTVYAVDCRLSLLSILPSTKKNLAIMQQNQKNVLLLNFP